MLSNAKAVYLRLVAERPRPRPARPAVFLQLETYGTLRAIFIMVKLLRGYPQLLFLGKFQIYFLYGICGNVVEENL